MSHKIQWMIGALPSEDGWYILAKRGISSPSLMKFNKIFHSNWERVIAWYGPITIPMNEVRGIIC